VYKVRFDVPTVVVTKDSSILGYDTMSTVNAVTFLLNNILEELVDSILSIHVNQDTSTKMYLTHKGTSSFLT